MDLKEIHTYQELEEILKQYIKSKKELKNIEFAYNYANEKHKDQRNEEWDLKLLLLDYYIFEDTPVKKEELQELFGQEVYELVESVTKVSFFAKEKREQLKSEYLRKLYLSMAKDVRVIIIKMADRMHNMLTITNLSEEKQKVIARETLEIYSTIAHRLGMKNAKI
ncbi:hypothetical protein FQA39_LY12878 [Lamprigera yunnana]|nr:hypothetical protein FQA39_LY12878 [Lamprigera yunnana]